MKNGMTIKSVFFTAIVAIFIGCLYYYKGSSNRPGRALPIFENNELSFNIIQGSTNGLLELTISTYATNKDVWSIRLNYFPSGNLRYGEVPREFESFNGAIQTAEQKFPKSGSPIRLAEGKEYKLHTDWQVDTLGTATVQSRTEYFKIENQKIVIITAPGFQ